MKLQNPSIHGSKDMRSLKSARTEERTAGQAQNNMSYQIVRSWGHYNRI